MARPTGSRPELAAPCTTRRISSTPWRRSMRHFWPCGACYSNPEHRDIRKEIAMTKSETFTASIKSGKLQLGIWTQIPHVMIAENLAQSGADFLLVDGEHAPIP